MTNPELIPVRRMNPNRYRSARPPIAPQCPPLTVACGLALVGLYAVALGVLLFR